MKIRLLGMAMAAVVAVASCREAADEEAEERARHAAAPAAAATPGVTLSSEALALSPVRVAPLAAASRAPVAQAFAQVVDATPLFTAAGALASRRAELDAAAAALAATRAEYERLRRLHADGENASLRSLEAAEAAFHGDENRVAGARAQLEASRGELRQAWGPVIAGWTQEGSASLQALADGRVRLLLVTLTGAEATTAPPHGIALEIAGRTVPAELVSAAPRTDPTLQGAAYYYQVASAAGALPAGLNVAVGLPAGAERHGVLVPEGAVVRWAGMRWVYRERAPGSFERVAVTDWQATDGGLFVTAGLAAGDRVAVAGAAVLLSQELGGLGLLPTAGED